MSELPRGWADATIADVTSSFASTDPTRTPDLAFRYVDIGSIDNQTRTIADAKLIKGIDAPSRARRVIRAGDTLFSTVRTYLKNIALVPNELDGELTSTGIAVLRPNQTVDPRYLFRWTCTAEFLEPMSRAQDGTMYPAVSDRDVACAHIRVPPFLEQRRIVAKIDSLSAKSARARDHLNHVLRLVEKYKQAILTAAFCGDLTREWRARRNIEAAWSTSTVGQVARIASGQTPKGIDEMVAHGGDVPWFKVSSMNEPDNLEGLRTSKFNVSCSAASKLGLRSFPIGSTAFPKRGGAIATNKKRRLFVAGALDLNIMVLTAELVTPAFLWWWMQKLDLASISNGSNVPQINNGDVEPLEIKVPSAIEQDQIAGRIEAAFTWIDNFAKESTSARKLVDHLDQAVLAKAFRGDLVPQDPDDEPASVLLQRIREERGAAAKSGRGRRSRTAQG